MGHSDDRTLAPERLDPTRDEWEQQVKESEPAYEAFLTYRNLGAKRSVAKVAAQLDKRTEGLHVWSKRWRWPERCRAWEAGLDAEYRAALVEERREMGRRHAQLARSVQGKVIQRLQTIDAETLTPNQLITWLETAAKIERQALGAPDATVAHTGDGGGPIRHTHEASLEMSDAARDFLSRLAEMPAAPNRTPLPSVQEVIDVPDADVLELVPGGAADAP